MERVAAATTLPTAAARRRGRPRPGRDVRALGPRARGAERARPRRRAARCCTRPTTTSPPRSTPPPACSRTEDGGMSGPACGATASCTITPESAGWGFSGLRVLELARGRARTRFETGEDELIVLPLVGRLHASSVDGETFALEGRDERLRRGRPTSPTSRATRAWSSPRTAAGASRCPRRAAGAAAASRATCARRGRARRAARRGPGEPPGQQLLRAGGLRGRPPDRRRGAHAGRQLVLVSAAQARRGRSPASRPCSRRSTTSRSRAAASATSASTARPGRRSTSAARSARGDAVADAARLPRPVDGRARATTSTTST